MKFAFLATIILYVNMCSSDNEQVHPQWEQDKLILPVSIVEPELDDMTFGDSTLIFVERRKNISLVQGFTFYENENSKNDGYKFYSEVNVDNPKLWNLSKKLLANFKNDVYIVYQINEDSLTYGSQYSVTSTIDKLDKIEGEILNNCNVSIGIVQDSKVFNELFIDESKYIQYWGNNESYFRTLMKSYGINEKEKMNFVDEFPRTCLLYTSPSPRD